ncbi:ABC transporter permease (plasmid) [Paracoccus methylovorus]|uniref:ABC transporter permease n=1 Tax=Paracoccus methylovorus TaxID=2812658 RepID=A0ABX7JPF0_9RHOB|nr:ABC transporter permease [Paracoccus methylovorus]QRZ16150.1 ABC transporter permease [Paracoccus methylovorus]
MHRFIIRRIFQALIALFLLSIAIFFTSRLTGSPCDVMLPPEAREADFLLCEQNLKLDSPVWVQYLAWISGVLQGDFGRAFVTGQPVMGLIAERLPNSAMLGLVSVIFTTLVMIPVGILGAVMKDTKFDVVLRVITAIGQALPTFWLGILLMWFFAVQLRWLPVAGMGSWEHFILPVGAMAWSTIASQSRMLRSSMLEVMDSEFVKLARVKGASESSVVFKHSFRNALIPVTTMIGMHFGNIITGAMIAEVVFAWPGLGRLLYEGISTRDFPLIQACVLVVSVITITFNLLVDILYAYIDPRIRYD